MGQFRILCLSLTLFVMSASMFASASVLEYQGGAKRTGHYTSEALTYFSVPRLQQDALFRLQEPLDGPMYAQPLFVENGVNGKDAILMATSSNMIYAVNADTGAILWRRQLPGSPVSRSSLPCGNINPYGVVGTPVIDENSKTIYLSAMTTFNDGDSIKHLIYGLSLEDGSILPNWPVDVTQSLALQGKVFTPNVQGQRGALTILNGRVYVTYGGHFGDCGNYHGWVVAVNLNNPTLVEGWATAARGGGIWAPGGVSSDGEHVYVTTGNTFGARGWSGGNAVIRLDANVNFSGQDSDFFAPTDWSSLDSRDADLSTAPMHTNIGSARGTKTPVTIAFGKDGRMFVLDPQNLGGVGSGLMTHSGAASVFSAPTALELEDSTVVAFNGMAQRCPNGARGNVGAFKIQSTGASGAPFSVSTQWCSNVSIGRAGLISSTSTGSQNPIVWAVKTSSGGLIAWRADTGAVLFEESARASVSTFQTPVIISRGRVLVPYNGGVRVLRP